MPKALPSGFSRSAVEELSRQKGEPEWMLQKRLQAWEIYEQTPTPLGRRGDLGTLRMFSNFKFQQLSPYVPSNGNGALPIAIEQSLEEALVDQRAGLVVQRNASVVRTELDEELKRQGVILTDLDSAVRDYPEQRRARLSRAGTAVFHDNLRTGKHLKVYSAARGILEWWYLPLHSQGSRN